MCSSQSRRTCAPSWTTPKLAVKLEFETSAQTKRWSQPDRAVCNNNTAVLESIWSISTLPQCDRNSTGVHPGQLASLSIARIIHLLVPGTACLPPRLMPGASAFFSNARHVRLVIHRLACPPSCNQTGASASLSTTRCIHLLVLGPARPYPCPQPGASTSSAQNNLPSPHSPVTQDITTHVVISNQLQK